MEFRFVSTPRSAHPMMRAKKQNTGAQTMMACIDVICDGVLNVAPGTTLPKESKGELLLAGGGVPPGKLQYPRGPDQCWYTMEFTSHAEKAEISFQYTAPPVATHRLQNPLKQLHGTATLDQTNPAIHGDIEMETVPVGVLFADERMPVPQVQ